MTHVDVSAEQSPPTGLVDPQADPAIDPRPRRTRLMGPLAAIGGLAAATTLIALVDPNVPGHYPACPTKLFLGVDCPGCGGLRATHDLAHGDIAGAWDNNALFVLLVPFIVFALGRNLVAAWTGRRPKPLPGWVAKWGLPALAVLVVVFTVVRNLPFAAYLGSG